MKDLKRKLIEFIKNYVETAGAKGVVVGMSGGKDSFVVAALAVEAIGENNVFGLIMPNGKQKDIVWYGGDPRSIRVRAERGLSYHS